MSLPRPARLIVPLITALVALLIIGAGSASAGTTKLVKYRVADGADEDPAKDNVVFFDKGGLKLIGSCDPDGPDSDLTIKARTSTPDSMIHWGVKKAGNNGIAAAEDDDFDPGGIGQQALILDVGMGFDQDSSGLIVYARPGGVNVSVKFAALEDTGFAGAKDCAFFGIARVLDSTSSSRVNFRALEGESKTFDTSGIHFDADCGVTIDDNLTVSPVSEAPDAAIGFDGLFAPTGYTDPPPDEDFEPGDPGPSLSDNAVGQHVFGAANGGANVTVDALYEDINPLTGVDPPFAGTKDCAWVGTARTRFSGDDKRVNFRKAEGTALTTFFEKGGLVLKGSCESGGELSVIARSKVDNAVISANRTISGPGIRQHSDPDFDNSSLDEYDLRVELTIGDAEDATGQLVYSKPDGPALTIDWMLLQGTDEPFGGTKDCAFVGTAEQKNP